MSRSVIFLPVVAAISCCASTGDKGYVFDEISPAPIVRSFFNEIHGSVTQAIYIGAFLKVGDGCLYSYRQRFTDSKGNGLDDMGASRPSHLLLMRSGKDCRKPIEPLISLDGIDVATYRTIEKHLGKLLVGSFREGNEVKAMDFSGMIPVSIVRSDEEYLVTFRSEHMHVQVTANLDSSDQVPVVQEIIEWQ